MFKETHNFLIHLRRPLPTTMTKNMTQTSSKIEMAMNVKPNNSKEKSKKKSKKAKQLTWGVLARGIWVLLISNRLRLVSRSRIPWILFSYETIKRAGWLGDGSTVGKEMKV
ncbi:hypothetical protein D8674_006237 [Pyrus ussuriensis x Pyrus communis]|uniref:Uncharacterized protein n=1 Tax=Pyrus ussuriensis x Pyrus communis TaxID=2448454 RepID=A0A5N5FYQ2_9ROSA|nr:hypothetical protein D8674_006237 [Pyrus ussuriensis x Pyrus communis]